MGVSTMDYGEYTILLVDDALELLEANAHSLRSFGFNVVCAENGRQALDRLKEIKIDIMVIDYFMPDYTGEEVIQEVRKTNQHLIILLQTGFSGDKPAEEMLNELKIQGYHDKTNGFDQLLVWIISCIRTCEQQRKIGDLNLELDGANEMIEKFKHNHASLIQRTQLSTKGQLISRIPYWLRDSIIHIIGHLEKLENRLAVFFVKTCGDKCTLSEMQKKRKIRNIESIIAAVKKMIDEDRDGVVKSAKYLKDKVWYYENTIKYADQSSQEITDWYLYSVTNRFVQFINNELMSVYDSFLEVQEDSLALVENLDFHGDIAVLLQVVYNLAINCAKYMNKYPVADDRPQEAGKERKIGKIYFYCTEEADSSAEGAKYMKIYIEVHSDEISVRARKEILEQCEDGGMGLGFFSSQFLLKQRFNGELWSEETQPNGENRGKISFGIKLPFKA